jgi:hypothetical protein
MLLSSSLLISGYREIFSTGLNWQGPEAGHSPASSAEVKNEWSYTSTPQCALMACKGIPLWDILLCLQYMFQL